MQREAREEPMRGARGGTDLHLGWHRMWITFESCMSSVFSLSPKSISGEPGSTGCPPILMKEVVSSGPFLCARQGAGCWHPSGKQDPVPVLGELTATGREMNTQQLWRQLTSTGKGLMGGAGGEGEGRAIHSPQPRPPQHPHSLSALRSSCSLPSYSFLK